MATAIHRASTPTPPIRPRTPPTPRWGSYQDNYEPYSPRKSARLSEKRAAANRARTPSPAPARRQPLASPRTAKKPTKHNAASTSSPMPSPHKKRQPAQDSVRRAAKGLTLEANAHAAAALGIPDKHVQRPAQVAGMLPTPSKTPQKAPSEKTAVNISRIGRKLFSPEEEIMPSPKKKSAKKYEGISLDSFRAEEIEESFAIYTDSHDRVPVVDQSEANPFWGNAPVAPVSTKRRSQRKKVHIPGEGLRYIDEVAGRDDGQVKSFRGKAFWQRKDETDELANGGDGDDPLASRSTKRLLFAKKKTQAMIEDEEALTDVEDDLPKEEAAAAPQTPAKPRCERAETPEAPKFAPVSPPSTRRTTRSTNKLAVEAAPAKASGRKSPFDLWPRTKEHKRPAATKRHADDLTPGDAKRARI